MQIGVINAAAVILTHVLAFLPRRIATDAIMPPLTRRYTQFTCVTDPQVLSLLALTHAFASLPRHIVIAACIMALVTGAIRPHLTRRYSVYVLLLVQKYKY